MFASAFTYMYIITFTCSQSICDFYDFVTRSGLSTVHINDMFISFISGGRCPKKRTEARNLCASFMVVG